MKNTSQKSVVKVEKMFRGNFLVILVKKKKKRVFQKSIKPYISRILMTREIMKKFFEIFGINLQKTFTILKCHLKKNGNEESLL